MDVLCLMHDGEQYGVLRWPLKEIAQAVGCKVSEIRGLVEKGVLKGADAGESCAAFTYTPRHAGKAGETVTLVPAQSGPVWFSSRMVTDEHVRQKKGESSRFGASPNTDPKGGPNKPPKGAPMPPFGDGSSSSTSYIPTTSAADPPRGAALPNVESEIWRMGVEVLTSTGIANERARGIIGKHVKTDRDRLYSVLCDMAATRPVEPVAYLEQAMSAKRRHREVAL